MKPEQQAKLLHSSGVSPLPGVAPAALPTDVLVLAGGVIGRIVLLAFRGQTLPWDN